MFWGLAMKTFAELISDLPAERKEAILARAEQLIREERAGRSAPKSNRDATATAVAVLVGAVLGLGLVAWVVLT